ncbi:MAG: alpha/beta hydrolase [Pseudomonadota bacterium]
MALFLRKTGGAISDDARKRIASLKPLPTLDMWRNPVTRGFARRLANEEWRKSLDKIDFQFRFSATNFGGVDGVYMETDSADNASTDPSPLILFVHGGGFVAGGAEVRAGSVLPSCHLSGCDAFGPDCSLLPEAVFPTQIDEADQAYRALCTEHSGRKIILFAESTGCAVALAALMRWREEGHPLPESVVLLSPCIDGTGASDTHIALDGRDPLIKSSHGAYARSLFRFYAPDHPLDDEAVSPIYGDFEKLPRMLIQAGSREVFLGDAARLSQHARRAGVDARLQIFDGMYQGFHADWDLQEAREAHQDIADFIRAL